MIPDDIVERVREHADIVSIVGEHVKLKRVGTSFRGPCPFHHGKDPNFSVSPKGGFMCFVCHEKGDVFTFVQKHLGMDFVDAVKYVGDKSGIEVKEVSREREQGPDPRTRFWEMNAAAAEYFVRVLWDEEGGANARGYLEGRGIDRATADRFGLGFSPRDPRVLREHLSALGYDDAAQIEGGLLVMREEKGPEPRPRFRNRLMFPIYDGQGRVIAFGGRVIGQGEPKYLNSAESPTFQKGSTLYGLNWAKNAIRRDDRVLLVEGYFDCLRLQAGGIESTVAPLGTALTEVQAETARRYTSNVFLLYDSDRAGLKATFRAGDILLRQGCKVLVVTLPDGEDPDTYVRNFGSEKLETQLGQAVDVLERKIQILQRGGWFNDLRRKRVALDRLLPTIAAAADAITRGLYLARTAEAVGVSEEVLQRELRQRATQGSGRTASRRDAPTPVDAERTDPDARVRRAERRRALGTEGMSAERELVRLLLHRRQFIESVAEQVGLDDFRDDRLASIFRGLVEAPDGGADALAAMLDEDGVALLDELTTSAGGLDVPARIIQDCVAGLRQRKLGEEIDAIDRRIPLADDAEKDRLVGIKQKLTTEMHALGGRRWKSFGGRAR
ncbi:MAG TPA: DNA primase [Gemmatimonadaceae bacterium]|nr:DNA primase [Gemmatimonadaceae bacterium]